MQLLQSLLVMPIVIHEREQDDHDVERYTKRIKLAEEEQESVSHVNVINAASPSIAEHVLPPSHSLLGHPLPLAKEGEPLHFREPDVGISEYIGRGEARIEGIIKQRSVNVQNN